MEGVHTAWVGTEEHPRTCVPAMVGNPCVKYQCHEWTPNASDLASNALNWYVLGSGSRDMPPRTATQGSRGTTQGTSGTTQGSRGSTQGTRGATQGTRGAHDRDVPTRVSIAPST